MQNENLLKTQDNKNNNKNEIDKRKRINRIKTTIIVISIFLLILPTILCILLGLQVSRLQQRVNELLANHNEFQQADIGGQPTVHTSEITIPYASANPGNILRYTSDNISNPLEHFFSYNLSDVDYVAEGLPNDAIAEALMSGQPVVKKQENTDKALDEAFDMDWEKEQGIVSEEKPETEPKNAPGIEHETESETGSESGSEIGSEIGSETDSETGSDKEAEKEIEKENKKAKDKEPKGNAKAGIYSGKTVYLTFDDGPSNNTSEILDILDEYNVKATFFVIGGTDKASKDLYKRIIDEGHTLGMHSYSHKYDKIYNSLEDFDKDFTKLWKLLYDTTGYKPTIYRFPGGSNNKVNKKGMKQFIKYLNDASIVYYDWNVLNGDATGVDYTEEQLITNVLEGVAVKKRSIVLLHDSQTKQKTVASLPKLLETLITGGAEILPLDNEVTPIQMIKADSID